jgi:hypothetical protein
LPYVSLSVLSGTFSLSWGRWMKQRNREQDWWMKLSGVHRRAGYQIYGSISAIGEKFLWRVSYLKKLTRLVVMESAFLLLLFFRPSPARLADKRALSACFVLLLSLGLQVLLRLYVRWIGHGRIRRGVIVLAFFLDGLCPISPAPFSMDHFYYGYFLFCLCMNECS